MFTGEIVFSIQLPMAALGVGDRFIAPYATQGVEIVNPTKQWLWKSAQYLEEFSSLESSMPAVFTL